jgi:hypothetical protein
MKRPMIALTAVPAAAVISLAIAGPALAGSATTPALKCMTWMSNSHPAENTTTDVEVHTARSADVFTRAHYTTGIRVKYQTATSKRGRATIPYDVRDTAPGYKVVVYVTVVSGHQANGCSTSFTPKP